MILTKTDPGIAARRYKIDVLAIEPIPQFSGLVLGVLAKLARIHPMPQLIDPAEVVHHGVTHRQTGSVHKRYLMSSGNGVA
ncbi:hypothetical protein Rhe02_52700 [Rhizocola hellebori]|uniref:Uncharacterized protein n=1 Tax=Rhizocola hellebori TaxID=1392758 RepID=A0A8J3QAG5_9ACTN|nr:hypothetical protein Rhe02_52700 [Rhizocola hellebori]